MAGEIIALFVAIEDLICIKEIDFTSSHKYNTPGNLLNNSRNY